MNAWCRSLLENNIHAGFMVTSLARNYTLTVCEYTNAITSNTYSLSLSPILFPPPPHRRRSAVPSWRRVFSEQTSFFIRWSPNRLLISYEMERHLSTHVKSFRVCQSCSVILLVSLQCAHGFGPWRWCVSSTQCTLRLTSFARNIMSTKWALP